LRLIASRMLVIQSVVSTILSRRLYNVSAPVLQVSYILPLIHFVIYLLFPLIVYLAVVLEYLAAE
jgi:hypothetical protein